MNIVITGASGGIGFQTVLQLLNNKSNVVIAISRNEKKLSSLYLQASNNGVEAQLFTLPFDIINGNYESQLLSFISLHMNHVDILINNAGELINQPFQSTVTDDFKHMMESNFYGHVKMIHAVVPYMKNGGHIVNIGSMSGYQGSTKFAGLSAYAASKAALHNLTESLSVELAQKQISVNCLALGAVQTPMLEIAFPDIKTSASTEDMAQFIAQFAIIGRTLFNGKIIPVAITTP